MVGIGRGARHAARVAACAVAVVAVGCSTGDGSREAQPRPVAPAEVAGSVAVAPGCSAGDGERPAKAVLRCTEGAVAFVETEVATGTGVVVDVAGTRYLVTNQHVVDPFDAADVTLAGETLAAVPVVGIDAGADIALLGPLPRAAAAEALPITDGTEVERGDDVFLVGFPGETGADGMEVTIASGIVSRLRDVAEFDQQFIQTDASIGGGQSGGPLFDGEGNLIGIAGLSFAEEFALALTGRDVRESVERIVAGEGDDHLAVPAEQRADEGATSGSVHVSDASDGQVLYLPAAGENRTWNLTVDTASRAVVAVEGFADYEALALSGHAATVEAEIQRELAASRGGRPGDLRDPSASGHDPRLAARETAPGTFRIPVEAHRSAIVVIGVPTTDAPVEVPWTSDLPLVPASRRVTSEQLAVGGRIEPVIGGLDTAVDVLVDLDAGQEVEVHARASQGDPAFLVFRPGQLLDHLTMADPEGAGVELVDDTDDGLYGLGARARIEAESAGMHRFRVVSHDFNAVKVRVTVVDCSTATCSD